MNFFTHPWDLELFRLANGVWRNSLLDWLMPLISSPVFLWGVVLAGIALGIKKHGKAQAWAILILLIALACADAGTNFVKDQIGRVRPLNALSQTHFVEDGYWQQRPADYKQTKEHGNSYPSAHAANSMAAAIIIFVLWRKPRKYVWALPLLVGYSRLYLGKHYPTDVLAGWTFGIAAALVGLGIALVLRDKLPTHKPLQSAGN